MQLLPETWEFVDTVLLGVRTPRNYAWKRPRRRSLPPLAARRVRREQAARARGLVPGSAGGEGDRPVRRHEALRARRARALRHGLIAPCATNRLDQQSMLIGGGGTPIRRRVERPRPRQAPEAIGRREDLDVEKSVPARLDERADMLGRARSAFAREHAIGRGRARAARRRRGGRSTRPATAASASGGSCQRLYVSAMIPTSSSSASSSSCEGIGDRVDERDRVVLRRVSRLEAEAHAGLTRRRRRPRAGRRRRARGRPADRDLRRAR